MKKVLLYILTEGKGGVEEYLMNLSRFCDDPSSKYGYLVAGERTVYEDELKVLRTEYFFVPKKQDIVANIKAYQELLVRLRNDYDTIYFNTSGLYYPIPYFFAEKYNYRIVLHSHLTSGARLKRPLHYLNRWWINKLCSLRLACSTPAGKWMFGDKERFQLIPNAIDIERFRFNKPKRDEYRKKYNLGDSYVIGNIGRLHQVKNQIFLIDFLKEIVSRNNDARLLLVGDGEMRPAIEDHARELNVLDRVVFAGQTNQPEYFYSAMDCFVMPSLVEGFPITLVEAQANGLPCVVADTITNETNITGHISFRSLSQTASSWADAILSSKERFDAIEIIKSKGYDVHSLAEGVYCTITKQ